MTLEYDYVVVLELKIIIPQINEKKKHYPDANVISSEVLTSNWCI